MKKLLKCKKGFSLIEVILAITVLGVVAVPLFATFGTSFAIMSKRQQSIENSSVIRLAKENVVDSLKGGITSGIESFSDLNGDSVVDSGDIVYWDKVSSGWKDSMGIVSNTADNLKIIDTDGNYDKRYSLRIFYDQAYTDANFGTSGYEELKKFTIVIRNKQNNKVVKSFNIVVDLDEAN